MDINNNVVYLLKKNTVESYIANIVTNRKISFDKLIRKTSSFKKVDLAYPTLIIGWNNVKSLYPKQSILDKIIDNKLFWTFDKNERKNEYEKDIKSFLKFVINDIESTIIYKFVNILTCKFSTYKRLINFIKNNNEKTIWIENNSFIYIYFNKFVVGISLSDLEYVNVDSNKIIELIKENTYNHVFTDLSSISYSLINIIGNNKQIIPYLLEKQRYL